MKILLLSILLTCANGVYGQGRWAISIDPAVGIQAYDREATKEATIPIDSFGPYEKPFYTSHLQYRLRAAVKYSLYPFLTPSVALVLQPKL